MNESTLSQAIGSTCMLVALRVTAYGTTVRHKALSQSTAAAHNAAHDAVRVSVSRLAGADALHKRIVSAQGAARSTLDAATVPYADSQRLLPATSFDTLARSMAKHKADFDALIAQLRVEAPAIIQSINLGDLADGIDPPTVESLVNAYTMKMEWAPVPAVSKNSFPMLPDVVAQRLAELHAERAQQHLSDGLADSVERIRTRLEKLVERLTAFDNRAPDADSKEGVFRDSIISNLVEARALAAELSKAVPGGSPILDTLVDRVGTLLATANSAKDLRASAELRAQTRREAQALVDLTRAS